MTEEELKAIAKDMGYNLIKAEPYIKFKPCTCGSNRRSHWYNSKGSQCYECKKCGKQSPWGKTEQEARKLWNFIIEKEEQK